MQAQNKKHLYGILKGPYLISMNMKMYKTKLNCIEEPDTL